MAYTKNKCITRRLRNGLRKLCFDKNGHIATNTRARAPKRAAKRSSKRGRR